MKKLISGKNLVTLLALVVLILILVFFYTKRVNDSINPVTVPYAKKQILAGVQITNDMVGTTNVPPAMLEGGVLRNLSDVVGKYTNADTVIPKGSLFYDRSVVEKEELPANIVLDLKEGYVLYSLPVDTESTYGNSIYPGNYIDIYLKAQTKATQTFQNRTNKLLLGKILENVEVLAVKDSAGRAVFKDLDQKRTPHTIIFQLPEDYFDLLMRASYLQTYNVELIPVPTNESLKNEPGELNISSENLKNWINEVTYWQG